jgi:Spy/CpxP family protein refolding chaperone
MKVATALFTAAAFLLPAAAFAQAPTRNQNLESECANTGSGMDPRCVGDTNPGTVSDETTSREQRAIERGAPSSTVVVPAEREVVIDRR